jgi:hypothetical protein
MKKIISLILLTAMLLSVIAINVHADEEAPENFLSVADSTFESGKTAWKAFQNTGTLETADNPDGEGKVLKYTVDTDAFLNKKNTWQAPCLEIKPILTEKLTEGTTVYIGLDLYAEGEFKFPVILRAKKEHLSIAEERDTEFPNLGGVMGNSEWISVLYEIEITDEDLLVEGGSWLLCLDALPKVREDLVVYIDNVYIGVDDPSGFEDAEIPEIKPISLQKNTLIGAIRWDAFFSTDSKISNVSRQVAKALSPKEFHSHAPFFSKLDSEGNVSFPEYTEELWLKETEYALEAGLDYFAYLWYESTDPMSQPRKIHVSSSKKNSIKMCGILEAIRSDKTMEELYAAMQEDCYVKLDGRPVLFLYQYHTKWTEEMVKELRQGAVNAGVEEAIYIVGMISTSDDIIESVLQKESVEAFSWYAAGPDKAGGEPYVDVAKKCNERVKSIGSVAGAHELSIIPCVTTGYDTRPRIKNPVTWITGDPTDPDPNKWPYGNRYTLDAAASDIGQHLKETLEYVKNNPNNAKANMVLSYAWNEHDEGGWICPTVKCDAEGNVLYNDDGTVQVDTQRIDEFKRVISEFRKSSSGGNGNSQLIQKPDASPTATAQATVEPNGDGTNNGGIIYAFIGAGTLIIIAGVITVILIKKRSKKDAKNS